MRHVVMWSGGIDSTVLLHRLALNSSLQNPIIALTIEHHQIHDDQQQSQRRAQVEYLKFAKAKGLHIDHRKIYVKGTIGTDGYAGQPILWFCHAVPYFKYEDEVHFAYIRKDDFWHIRERFEVALEAIRAIYGFGQNNSVKLCFDLEWKDKSDIWKEFQSYKIPNRCIWTCEESKNGKPCGKCKKCKELEAAKQKG